ncbi:AMP-binding protein [Streptomyces qaidamensis]|uniref:AMP-binding protein n=1 Tax=Streptomyces qaidamensis TaxID=1783515 RepID=UPI000D182946
MRYAGVAPESVVGLCLPRGWTWSWHARGLAGRWRVPALDPEYPADRLEFMLADSGTKVVVGSSISWTLPSYPVMARQADARGALARRRRPRHRRRDPPAAARRPR